MKIKQQQTKGTFATTLFIQQHKTNSEGKATILARIIVNGETTSFSTKLQTLPNRWISKEYRTLGHTKEEREINETLAELRSMIKRRYHELINNGEAVSAVILKNSILSIDDKCITLLPLCDMFTKDYYQLVLSGSVVKDSYQRYVYTRNRLAEYMAEKYNIADISLKGINHNFIKGFDLWLRGNCGCGNNTASKLVKHFRTMFNVALNNGWIQADPFANYKIIFEKVDRGYLTNDELERLAKEDFESEKLNLVRDMFLFSCYTGLAYADVEKLTFEDIQVDGDGRQRIVSKRKKTNVGVTIPLLDLPLQIIERYRDKKRWIGKENRLLPIYSNQKCNDYLKPIAARVGINKALTYHLARHTFATTITLANGMPIETVSRLLGHTSIKTTQIYARITDTKIGADMDILARKIGTTVATASV